MRSRSGRRGYVTSTGSGYLGGQQSLLYGRDEDEIEYSSYRNVLSCSRADEQPNVLATTMPRVSKCISKCVLG